MNPITAITRTGLGASAAAVALLGASPAMAQPSNLDPAAITAAARYALPIAFDSFVTSCSANLAPGGYALSNSDRLMVKFSEGSDENWPAAKQAMIAMASEGDDADGMAAIFDVMGDEELRPFVDALVGGLISGEIKADDCEIIERGLEILDPLPADNLAQVVGLFFELGANDEEEGEEEEFEEYDEEAAE